MQQLFKNFFEKDRATRQSKRETAESGTRTKSGMTEHQKRILRYENLHLSTDMDFSEHGFPIIAPYNGPIPLPCNIYPYNERKGKSGIGQGLHFFVSDYSFAQSLWYDLYQKTISLRRFDLLFAPDYSFYVNPDYSFISAQGIYRNRFITAYWQKCKLNVVPVASHGSVDTFSWCYEGLPERSIIAVGNETVHLTDHASVTLWQWSVRELEAQKRPTLILVYGKRIEIPGIKTPVKYINGYIYNHFRNGKRDNQ